MSSYTKLRDGTWGVRSDTKVATGDTISVRKKDGESKLETVRAVLWTGPDSRTGRTIWLCAIERDSGGRERAYGGYFCKTCGHDGDGCADMDCTCHACGGMMR